VKGFLYQLDANYRVEYKDEYLPDEFGMLAVYSDVLPVVDLQRRVLYPRAFTSLRGVSGPRCAGLPMIRKGERPADGIPSLKRGLYFFEIFF
jgi:hypothetical protein